MSAPIHFRSIPSTGEKIPCIGLGTWQSFDAGSNAARRKNLEKVLHTFTGAGAHVVDSSPMYGSSESVVGDLVDKMQLREQLFFATKVWTRGREEGIRQMEESFQKMKTGVMDLMQVHNLLDVDVHLRTLRAWKEQGRLRYIGITHYTTGAYPDLIRLIESEPLDFVQFNYNIQVREAERRLLPLAQEKGVAVLINRPFEEGALFTRVRGRALPPWAAEYDIHSWSQFFLKFIIAHPAVTCIIPATADLGHLEDNLGGASGVLPDVAEREKMAAWFAAL